jgi:hypothetical protein
MIKYHPYNTMLYGVVKVLNVSGSVCIILTILWIFCAADIKNNKLENLAIHLIYF